jgi:hypothetical protein
MNPNLRAQRGVFTWMPEANAQFKQHRRWASLTDVFAASDAVHAVTLPNGQASCAERASD